MSFIFFIVLIERPLATGTEVQFMMVIFIKLLPEEYDQTLEEAEQKTSQF